MRYSWLKGIEKEEFSTVAESKCRYERLENIENTLLNERTTEETEG